MSTTQNRHDPTQFVYSVPMSSHENCVGESPVYRRPENKNGLIDTLKSDPSLRTVHDIYIRAFSKFGDRPHLGTREILSNGKLGAYKFKTYSETQDQASRLGSGMINMKLTFPNRDYKEYEISPILCWSKNREEWVITDVACVLYNLCCIPVYATLGPEALTLMFEQTRATSIFLSKDHLNGIFDVVKSCPTLKNVVCFDSVYSDEREKAEQLGLNLYSFEEVMAHGKHTLPYRHSKPTDLYTINYTSGTTGLPKGAMIQHSGPVASCTALGNKEDINLNEYDVYLSYLPLAHTMERTMLLAHATMGVAIGFYHGDPRKIDSDLQELKPTFFASVPRLYNRFYQQMKDELNSFTGLRKSLIEKAVKTKTENLIKFGALNHGIYDKFVFNKLKQHLGGRIRMMLTASAPMEPEIKNFLRISLGAPIVEGYGQTELCSSVFMSQANVHQTCNAVGGPKCSAEFKVVDVADMDYTCKDKDMNGNHTPRGEICVRGPQAFCGYYKDPVKTSETIDKDGWVHTGDIGRINPDGSLSVIDRKKNIFKLSQGEYICPEKVENAYLNSRYVAEAFVHGDTLKHYCVGVVVPKQEAILELANELGLTGLSFEQLCLNKDVRARVLADITKKGRDNKINSFELAKQLHIEPTTFGDKGLLTPTFKLMRHVAVKYYDKVIHELYALPYSEK